MDRLWTPWRYAYVTGAQPGVSEPGVSAPGVSEPGVSEPGVNTPAGGEAALHARRRGVPQALSAWPGDCGCVFCNMIAALDYAVEHGMTMEEAEGAAWILERGRTCFLVLNAFPYNSGHLMAVPYRHEPSLAGLPLEVADELMRLTRRAERVLRAVYRPDGLNLGINLGESAGAGVAGHLHLHAVPRWSGDNNYMSVLAETRILPETLGDSWRRLRAGLAADRLEPASGDSAQAV